MSDRGDDDLDGGLFAAWEEDDREAASMLHALLPDTLHTEPPQPDLDEVVTRLRSGIAARHPPRWQTLGALDDDRRLTRLGAWGLPHALLEAWGGCGDSGPTTATEVVAVGPPLRCCRC